MMEEPASLRRLSLILRDLEGLILKPTDVARQARRIRQCLSELGIEVPEK